jgi:hypothetical protein
MTIQVIENFISKEDAKFIVENFSKNLSPVKNRDGFFEDLFFRSPAIYNEKTLDPNNVFESLDESRSSARINHIMHLACLELEKFYGVKINKSFGGMTKLVAGAFHGVHSDTHNLDGSMVEDDPESKYIKYSAIVYLSEYNKDFTGGVLEFPNQSIEIEPSPGLFVFFESDHRNPHQVTEIKSGERHSVVMFFG